MAAPAHRFKSVRPDCFRVSFVSGLVTQFWPESFLSKLDAAKCAEKLVAGKAKVAVVYAAFGERLIELHRFTKGD